MKIACSSSFLLLLFDLFSFLLAISLLWILLGVVFKFWLCMEELWPRGRRRKRKKMLSLFLNFFLSFLVLFGKIWLRGGEEPIWPRGYGERERVFVFIFPFLLVILFQNFNIAFNAYQILSSGLAKTMCF